MPFQCNVACFVLDCCDCGNRLFASDWCSLRCTCVFRYRPVDIYRLRHNLDCPTVSLVLGLHRAPLSSYKLYIHKGLCVFLYRLKQASNSFYGGLTNAGRSCYIRNAKIGVWTELNGKIRIVVDKFPFTAFWRRCDVCDNLNI